MAKREAQAEPIFTGVGRAETVVHLVFSDLTAQAAKGRQSGRICEEVPNARYYHIPLLTNLTLALIADQRVRVSLRLPCLLDEHPHGQTQELLVVYQ